MPSTASLSYTQFPYNYAAAPASPAQPLPLGRAICQLPAQYWRIFTRPGAATLAYEQSKANWHIVWVQLITVAVISAPAIFATTSLFSALENTSSKTKFVHFSNSPGNKPADL